MRNLLNLVSLGLLQVKIQFIWFVTWPQKKPSKKKKLRGHLNLFRNTSRYITLLTSLVTIGIVIVEKNVFNFSLLIYRWGLFTVKYHLAMFGGHFSSESGDKKVLRFHMTWQEHVIERSCSIMAGTFQGTSSSFQFRSWYPLQSRDFPRLGDAKVMWHINRSHQRLVTRLSILLIIDTLVVEI